MSVILNDINIFLPLNLTMCFGAQKNRDGSFEFWMRNKENISNTY